ncbi:MAG TPA: carboxypeptidase-like regulatory domain-containing protein [Kofleriaceae bacterium]|nr:carboxypeptidase-like regulatory domain-containing protein [Kofleriaceae bacterium]
MRRVEWLGIGGACVCAILAHASAAIGDQRVGDAGDAAPGLVHLAVPAQMDPGVTVAWTSGYGFRGETLAMGDRPHRLAGNLSLSVRPRPWLAAGLRLDGRYDRHAVDGGTDSGWVGDPRIDLRAHRARGNAAFGIAAGLWFPAADLLSLAGTSAELRGLGSYRLDDVTLAANLGLRLDRSAATVDDPDRLSLADRMALGASDANAVLLGLGLAWRRGPIEIAGEWSWDLLVGSGAPAAAESPMRLSVEARRQLRGPVWLRIGFETSVSSTPVVEPGAPLVPIEPRVAVWLGAIYRFGGPAGDPPARPIRPAVLTGALEGRVVDDAGAGVAGATVRAGELTVTTDADGRYRFEALPVGEIELEIAAPRFRPRTITVRVTEGEVADVAAALEPTLPPGQIRGLVRTLSGKPIRGATIRLEPLGTMVESSDDGSFRVDVQPGRYTLEVRARGYASQRRTIQVDENGVTVLNVELRQGQP